MTLTGVGGRPSPHLLPLDAGRDRTDFPVVLLSLAVTIAAAVPVVRGKIQLLPVVCLLVLPFVVRHVARDRRVLLLIVAAASWGAGQLAADKVNGLGLRLSLPLALACVVLGTAPVLVKLARGDFRRMRFLALGVAGGLMVNQLILEKPLTDPASWKYGLNAPVTLTLLALTDLAWQRGHRVPTLLALAAVCGLGLWSDHRGLTGIAMLTTLYVMLPRRRHRHRYPRISSVAAGVALVLGALSILFVDSAQSGLLGERSVAQVQQYGSDPASILVNVRPELFQELSLFLQRPLTGFGSEPHLSTSTYDRSLQFIRSVGVTRTADLEDYWLHAENPGVSAHSMAVDSWARAGISAVPFWIFVIVVALWAGTTALQFRSSPLVVMWTMLVLWDTLFSPLPGSLAVQLAAYLALALVTIATTPTTPSHDHGARGQGRAA